MTTRVRSLSDSALGAALLTQPRNVEAEPNLRGDARQELMIFSRVSLLRTALAEGDDGDERSILAKDGHHQHGTRSLEPLAL